MPELKTQYRETAARHRGGLDTRWWLADHTGQARHSADELCPSEDERRRSEVQLRQRHRL